jgi:hypothetical protein
VADEGGFPFQIVGELLCGTFAKKHLLVVAGIEFAVPGVRVGHLGEIVGALARPLLYDCAEFNLALADRPTAGTLRL